MNTNTGDTDIDEILGAAKRNMEWSETNREPTLLEYLRYYRSRIIGERYIEAAITKKLNEARIDELSKLEKDIWGNDEPGTNACIGRIRASVAALQANKEKL